LSFLRGTEPVIATAMTIGEVMTTSFRMDQALESGVSRSP
jgi:hypothetical protein